MRARNLFLVICALGALLPACSGPAASGDDTEREADAIVVGGSIVSRFEEGLYVSEKTKSLLRIASGGGLTNVIWSLQDPVAPKYGYTPSGLDMALDGSHGTIGEADSARRLTLTRTGRGRVTFSGRLDARSEVDESFVLNPNAFADAKGPPDARLLVTLGASDERRVTFRVDGPTGPFSGTVPWSRTGAGFTESFRLTADCTVHVQVRTVGGGFLPIVAGGLADDRTDGCPDLR